MKLVGTLYAVVYLFMLGVMFILPKFTHPDYSIIGNSLSELGAQNTPGNWIMNLTLFLLAIVVVLLGVKKLQRFWFPLYLLYFFAISLFFTGVFKHAPIADVAFSMPHHITHVILSSLTGVVFCVYCAAIVVYVKKRLEKAIAIFMCALAVGLSLLMFEFSEYRGIFQRLLFLFAFAWILYSLVTYRLESPKKR